MDTIEITYPFWKTWTWYSWLDDWLALWPDWLDLWPGLTLSSLSWSQRRTDSSDGAPSPGQTTNCDSLFLLTLWTLIGLTKWLSETHCMIWRSSLFVWVKLTVWYDEAHCLFEWNSLFDSMKLTVWSDETHRLIGWNTLFDCLKYTDWLIESFDRFKFRTYYPGKNSNEITYLVYWLVSDHTRDSRLKRWSLKINPKIVESAQK